MNNIDIENFTGSVKSFYGKAKIINDGGCPTLYSYGTPVCRLDNGRFVRLWGDWSATAGRHISAFCKAVHSPVDYGRKANWDALEVAA